MNKYGLTFLECRRLNVSCKNCFKFGKCTKTIIKGEKMNWFNFFVYLGIFLITAIIWYFIVYYVIDWFK